MLTNVTADDALYLARYFAPKWTEMRGCVVRADAVADDAFDEWWESTDGDRQRLEYVVNHVHLWDMLPGTDDTDYGELWDLARCSSGHGETACPAPFPIASSR